MKKKQNQRVGINPHPLITQGRTRGINFHGDEKFIQKESQGFEPWEPVIVQRFSRPSQSATLTTLLKFLISNNVLYVY